MTTYWKFYLPENHPIGLSGVVGGGISTDEALNDPSAIFAHLPTNDSSEVSQYRKLFAKQVTAGAFENLTVELANVEYPSQISFAVTGMSGDITGQSSDPQVLPDGYTTGMFSGNADLPLTGLLASALGDQIGIWIRQAIPAAAVNDDLASFVMRIRATKID